MREPNLFIVGAPKCGTTSLHYYLSQHPEICMSKVKEPYFFCKDLIAENRKFTNKKLLKFGYDTKEEYLKAVGCKSGKIVGEASVWYLYSKVAAREIYKHDKNAKIIVMVRDPAELIISLHAHYLARLSEDKSDLMQAIKPREKFPKATLFPSKLDYIEVARLGTQIERYLKVFAPENMKVIIFDDFVKDTPKVYSEILSFLGVTSFTPNFEKKNENIRIRFRAIKVLSKFPSIFKGAKKVLPETVYSKIKKAVTVKRGKVKNLKHKQELQQILSGEVVKLEKITGVELKKMWGYK